MEIEFPIEFVVHGTPLSLGLQNPVARERWKARVRAASSSSLPQSHFASNDRIAVTIYHMPEQRMQGDVDNIVKLILDGMCQYVFLDDRQVERVVVQKFETDNMFSFAAPTSILTTALGATRPVTYVRVSNNPFEDLI